MITIKGIKFISSIVALLLFFNTFHTLDVYGSEKKNYTYNQINKMYREESLDSQLLEIEKKMMNLDHSIKSDDLLSLKSTMNSSKSTYENKKDKNSSKVDEARDDYYDGAKAYYDALKEVALLEFDIKYEDTLFHNKEKVLQYQFEQQLWDYYMLKDRLDLLTLTKDMTENQLKVTKTRYELNQATGLDVLKAENEYDKILIQLEGLNYNLLMLEKSIKITLDIPLEQEMNIIFDPPVELEQPVTFTLDSFINAYKKDSLDMMRESYKVEVEENYKNELLQIYSDRSHEYKNVENQYDKVVLDKYNYDKSLDSNLISAYYAYLQSVDQLALAKESCDLSQQQYEEAKLAYKKGLISGLELDGLALQHHSIKADYEGAIIQYNMAIKKVELLFQGIIL